MLIVPPGESARVSAAGLMSCSGASGISGVSGISGISGISALSASTVSVVSSIVPEASVSETSSVAAAATAGPDAMPSDTARQATITRWSARLPMILCTNVVCCMVVTPPCDPDCCVWSLGSGNRRLNPPL